MKEVMEKKRERKACYLRYWRRRRDRVGGAPEACRRGCGWWFLWASWYSLSSCDFEGFVMILTENLLLNSPLSSSPLPLLFVALNAFLWLSLNFLWCCFFWGLPTSFVCPCCLRFSFFFWLVLPLNMLGYALRYLWIALWWISWGPALNILLVLFSLCPECLPLMLEAWRLQIGFWPMLSWLAWVW